MPARHERQNLPFSASQSTCSSPNIAEPSYSTNTSPSSTQAGLSGRIVSRHPADPPRVGKREAAKNAGDSLGREDSLDPHPFVGWRERRGNGGIIQRLYRPAVVFGGTHVVEHALSVDSNAAVIVRGIHGATRYLLRQPHALRRQRGFGQIEPAFANSREEATHVWSAPRIGAGNDPRPRQAAKA